VNWVVLAAPGDRAAEARARAQALLADAGVSDVRVNEFRDGFLPYVSNEVNDVFEGLKEVRPDLVITHSRHDFHRDHRLACELTWNTFRNHLILEYEIPKYDGDLGAPNVFVPLEESLVEDKLPVLRDHYASQHGKHWFDDELFRALMPLRGMERASRYAGAFTCRKLTLLVA
jgi:LmbE family N-acetylglucosaminyl deacetylase